MSSYTFSHQFYQRWTRAPEVIRGAITQELADITVLLQPETRLETYQFSIEDLDAHLDILTREHDAKLKAEAERQALAEKQRLIDQEKQEREARRQKREQNERLAEEKAAQDKQRREEEQARAEQAATDDAEAKKAQQEAQNLPTETNDNIAKTQKSDIAISETLEQQSLADDVDALFEDIRAQNESAELSKNDETSEKEELQSEQLTAQNDSSDSQANATQTEQESTLEAESIDAENTDTKNSDSESVESLATENDNAEAAESKSSTNETIEEAAAEKHEAAPAEEASKSVETAPSNQAQNKAFKPDSSDNPETQKDLPESLNLDVKSADDITQALSNHLDDFLTDKMMQLSDDLKAWLKEEVSRQLAELDAKNKQAQK